MNSKGGNSPDKILARQLAKELVMVKDSLAWYANKDNYKVPARAADNRLKSPVMRDAGSRARQTLAIFHKGRHDEHHPTT